MEQNDDCDCCAGLNAVTPARPLNPAGQPAVAYRVGKYSEFRESMLARLSSSDFAALSRLTARDDADFSIGLCDAWATVLDVLSFYQERIINENFLRTASERRSILELARLIGYQLAPGVAASTWLAFTLQDAPGLPDHTPAPVPVPAGTRVQSVPGPDDMPQTFETTETIDARAAWNALPVRTTQAWLPQRGDTDMWLAGVATGLMPGDALLIVGQERSVADPASERWDVRILTQVEPDLARAATRVVWADGLGSLVPPVWPAQDAPRVYVLRQRASLFGYNAPDPRLMSAKDNQLGSMTESVGGTLVWKNYTLPSGSIDLDAAYPKITAGSWIALASNQAGIGLPSLPGYVELYRVKTVALVARADFGLSAKITRIVPDTTEHLDSRYTIARTLVLGQSEALAVAPRPLGFPLFGTQCALGSLQRALTPGRALAVSGKAQRLGIAAGAHGLVIALDGGGAVPLTAGDPLWMVAAPLTRAGSATFALTPEAFGAALGTTTALRLTVRDRDGTVGILDVAGNQIMLLAAQEQDETLAEIVLIGAGPNALQHDRDGTMLTLAAALRYVYDRTTVRVNANVAPATHGETVNETLGGSSAATPNQRFTLRQAPLTYTSAATSSGRASSLALRVNDLLWQQVPSLYGYGSADRVFTTALDDSGNTTVMFGDGVEGARPSSGQDNVRARYRKGLGAGGNVRAAQLSNLLTRPLGVSGVTNPEAARGGQDAEAGDAARANAPLTVLTLDRAVSVQDYENFSRGFAGIAKAHAGWIEAGPGRGIFVTVAGENGDPVDPSGATYGYLLAALRRYGDALLPLRLATYRPAVFRARITLKIAGDAEVDPVIARVRAALGDAFGFAVRHFGQQVSVDEVAAVAHSVASVVAVNVITLYRPDQGAAPRFEPRLFARLPEASLTALPQAAELLLLDTSALSIEVMA